MEYGRILEAAAQNEDVIREFGVNGEPLKINASKLRAIIRDHFAHTLARMSVLRDIRMEEDAKPWQVLQDFRKIVGQVETGNAGALPPLAAQDMAVLSRLVLAGQRLAGVIPLLHLIWRAENGRQITIAGDGFAEIGA